MSDTHSETTLYVAEQMLGPSSPPIGKVGALAWLRQSLFSSFGNTLVTVLCALFIVYLLVTFLPWFYNGVWDASSLGECREKLAGVHAACWGVIDERFNQLMFGRYPETLLWRPTLALFLFFLAIVPVLAEGGVRKFWPLSLLYPVVAYYLVWGGSVWTVVAFLGAFALAYVTFAILSRSISSALASIAALSVAVLYWLFLDGYAFDLLQGAFGNVGLVPVGSALIGGVLLAMIIGVSGIVLSFPIGVLLALGRQSKLPIVRMICIGFIEFVRGVPLITLLFVASTLLNFFLPRGVSFDLLLRVIILVVLFASAYIAEVVRGGLAALPKGQYEAAQSLGLPYWDSMRLIILPQALKVAIPGIVSTFIGLFKDTTLVSIIGLSDVLGIRTLITSAPEWTGIFWELIVFAAVFFWICCFSMSRYSMYYERKLDTGHRN